VVLLLVVTTTAAGGCGAATYHMRGPATAFFYGERPPIDQLVPFRHVVLEPETAGPEPVKRLTARGVTVFAYLAAMEVDRTRPWYKDLQKRWVLGENRAWNSAVLDLRLPPVRAFLLDLAQRSWDLGYRGFFLDTMDSHLPLVSDPAARKEVERGLIQLVLALHKRFPGVRLLSNRGFEVLPRLAPLLSGVVAESLFAGWDPATRTFRPVAPAARAWLLPRLRRARAMGLPVTVIDYMPPRQRRRARGTARLIADLGFIPWIASPMHDTVGMGELEPVPRRVLVLHDSGGEDIARARVHLKLGPVLDYLGLVPRFVKVRGPLPPGPQAGRYAGVILWNLQSPTLPTGGALQAWLGARMDEGLRLAVFGMLGFEPTEAFLARLGVVPNEHDHRGKLRQVSVDPTVVGFEAPPVPDGRPLASWRSGTGAAMRTAYRLQDASGVQLDPVAFGAAGALVQAPFIFRQSAGQRARWVLEPFAFLRRALALPRVPVPDITTENGSRLLTAHIDGDGFPSKAELPGAPLSGEVVLRRILARYRLPTTVSVVEGEVGPAGLYPQLSRRMERIARRIFAEPYVELASHSFSHPFSWRGAEGGVVDERHAQNHMKIPGYHFDLHREVAGSVGYIDRRLAPRGKRTRVFLWTGDCVPSARAVAMSRQLGLLNVNGGDTDITRDHPSLTRVGPMGREVPGGYQVYAPVMNENIYTNLWRGPFWGYQRALESFRLTDAPRRLKPMGIYYHFYSGTKEASLRALEKVYDGALAAAPLPLYLSEYARRVEAFRHVSIARRLGGGWELHRRGGLPRTVRIPDRWPDLVRSRGVAGVRVLPQGRYLALDDGPVTLLATIDREPQLPHLVRANAALARWSPGARGTVSFRLRGHMPVKLTLGGVGPGCRVDGGRKKTHSRRRGGRQMTLHFRGKDTGEARIVCK